MVLQVLTICTVLGASLQLISRCSEPAVSSSQKEICQKCEKDFFLSEDRLACSPCTAGCRICGADSVCVACLSGYFLDATTCVKCSKECISCGSTGCTLCQSGFSAVEKGLCIKCIENCAKCKTLDSCEECQGTFEYGKNPDTERMECASTQWTVLIYIIIGVILVACIPLMVLCACSSHTIDSWMGSTTSMRLETDNESVLKGSEVAEVVAENEPEDFQNNDIRRRKSDMNHLFPTAQKKRRAVFNMTNSRGGSQPYRELEEEPPSNGQRGFNNNYYYG